jgi:uncharacterized membrane protein
MRRLLLQTLAVTSWVAVTIGTFDGYDNDRRTFSQVDFRIWLFALSVAILTTLAVMIDQAARTYREVTKAAVTRPPYAGPPSGPLARLVTTGPLAKLMPFVPPQNGHRGQHSRR